MKNKLFLFIFALSLSFVSCEKNNDDTSSLTEDELTGTWNLTALYSENGTVNVNVNGSTINGTFEVTASDFNNATLTFGDNPKNVTSNGSFKITSTISVLGQTETNTESIDNGTNSGGTWSLNGGTISITEQGETIQFKIESFDGTTLKISSTLSEVNILEIDEGDLSGSLHMTLTK